MLEIELKFPLADEAAFRARLAELGAESEGVSEQSDAYFNHPSRDFAQTDEALRIRTVGEASRLTYKGAKLGGAAKTRFEQELPLAEGTTEGWREVLLRLGFREVTAVRKRREAFSLTLDGRAFELTIDRVEGLGLYAEVETLADETSQDDAEQAVVNLAGRLGLSQPEGRSYLEMLLGEMMRRR
ncbi:CYTH domain protein [Pseudobythopirellula maris]|uniref:CYTH domain protein n=1 Tax=Pseudobythopirellula maris TaxID=2527991 RepID=A0A5C5ZHI1_9BACT|nr:class IV adenylate cyclase [Pseudobythopirellula maris]TWT86869.1 CYTH domain protein [Pseudobythopirellula maris]